MPVGGVGLFRLSDSRRLAMANIISPPADIITVHVWPVGEKFGANFFWFASAVLVGLAWALTR